MIVTKKSDSDDPRPPSTSASCSSTSVKRYIASNIIPAPGGPRIITIPLVSQGSIAALPSSAGTHGTVVSLQAQPLALQLIPKAAARKDGFSSKLMTAKRIPVSSLNTSTAVRATSVTQAGNYGSYGSHRSRDREPLDFSDMSAFDEIARPRAPKRRYYEYEREIHRPVMPDRESPFLLGARGRLCDRSKGLRHFSTKVCDKVREKGLTTYNEVADELVSEYFDSLQGSSMTQEQQLYDQKNIRRRVYDALNVLMAMNIIAKERKEIRWIGLPTSSSQEVWKLEEEKKRRLESIQQKTEKLHELIVQQVAFKKLVERNREHEKQNGKPSPTNVLNLPFIVVATSKDTVVDCNISNDKTEYLFTFNQPFLIYDDVDILKRLGLTKGLEPNSIVSESSQIKPYLPPALQCYVDQITANTRALPILEKLKRGGTLLNSRAQRSNEEHSSDAQPTVSLVSTNIGKLQKCASDSSLDAVDAEVALTMGVARVETVNSSPSGTHRMSHA